MNASASFNAAVWCVLLCRVLAVLAVMPFSVLLRPWLIPPMARREAHRQLADLQRHYGSANETERVMRAVEDAHEIGFKTSDPDAIQPD